jgi:indolepyruvate ferredoxin oxidoreductase alpha subunit
MAGFDLLLQEAPRTEYVLGNYAFVRGMLEAGVQVATCYPGSPTAEMANAMMAVGQKAGVYFEISTNEKVALEIAATSSIAGRPAVAG